MREPAYIASDVSTKPMQHLMLNDRPIVMQWGSTIVYAAVEGLVSDPANVCIDADTTACRAATQIRLDVLSNDLSPGNTAILL